MNDEHATPPAEDRDDQSEPKQLPKAPEELQEALKAIHHNDDTADVGEDNTEQPSPPTIAYEQDILTAGEDLRDSVSQERELPRSERELRLIVREIVTEVLEDVDAVRRAAAEPVEVVTVPQLMIPRIRLSPMQIVLAVAAAVIVIGGPITWATWPRTAEIPDGAVGLWRTVTPSYADRAFRITKTTLTFHVSPQDSTFHPIVRVRETEYMEERGTTEYTVYYTHYRDEYEFSFLYREDPDTTIRFINQKEMAWRKGSS
jgi:hypothetical protein